MGKRNPGVSIPACTRQPGLPVPDAPRPGSGPGIPPVPSVNLRRRFEKELAGNLLYEKHLSEFNIGSDSAEVVQYYNSNSEQFNLVEDAFIVNCIIFSEKRIASKFKSNIVKNKWANIIENYNQSDLVIEDCFNKLYYKSQLKSKSYYDKIKRMNIGTVVSFVESEPEEFVIIQLVDKYVANTIPKIEYLFDEIREHMIATKQKSIYNNLINKLYSDYNVEIKR